MLPDYYFEHDERTEVVSEEGVIFSNCSEIYFTNRSSFDIFIEGRRVVTDETFAISSNHPLVINKKRYQLTYKKTTVTADKTPIHPAVKLEVRRVYYYLKEGQLKPETYNK